MMKKIYSVLSVLLTIILMGVFVSCERDKEVMLTAVSITNEQITPMYKSATISSTISSEATIRDVFVQYTVTKDFAEYDEVPMQEKDGIYTAELIDLLDNTTYYYRYAASNRHSAIVLQKIQQFATLQPTAPAIRLDSILTVWDSYAQVQVALEFDGGASVTDMGVCWGTQANPTIEDIHKSTKDTVAVLDIPSLQSNTQYYVRAYAVNKVGVAYSEELVFTTYALPEVRTEEVADIQVNTVLLSATLLFDGNDTAIVKGFCWSDKAEPTIDGNHIAVDTTSAHYTYLLPELLPATEYHVRAYAQNKIGMVYGEEKTFTTTKDVVSPTVTTATVTQITETTAVAGGDVTSDGGASVTERGVVYSINQNPTIADNKVSNGSGMGTFTCNLIDLQPNTTYYVRAYATNEVGTAYGEEVSFTTKEVSVSDPTGTENGYAYVDLGLSVKWATMNVGASSPEDYGDYFAWGETEPKTTYNWSTYKWCNGSSSTLTKYNNSSSYGIVDNKTQLELTDDAARANWGGSWRMPTEVEMTELREQCTWTWTTQNGVNGCKVTSKSNGNSIFLPAAGYCGGSSSGREGLYWSSSLETGSPDGARGVSFASSNAYRNGFYRYAGLPVRPVLGENEVEVTTPTVTTTTVTQITETTALVGGNVTSDGGANVTERGVVYSTNPNPVITNLNNTIRSCGSGTGAFAYNMTGLQSGTTYYVRAYAKNDVGTAYGEEVSFTTKEEIVDNPPSHLVAMPFSVSANKQVYFSKGNLQYHPANNEWRFAESQLDYIGNANKNISSTYNGWLDLFGWSTNTTNFGVSTSKNSNDYSGSFQDWGQIQIGTDTPNTWSTLTLSEWEYVLNYRANADMLCGIAQVNGVNGLILLPDNWINPDGITFKYSFHSNSGASYYADFQIFTSVQWSKMESLGAVFLPAAGERAGEDVGIMQHSGYYWSSSEKYSYSAFAFRFFSEQWSTFGCERYIGNSVRLVKDSYGKEGGVLPSVHTNSITQITETTAMASGNVTNDGGSNVTERGVVYATTQNPTTADNKVSNGSGIGTFTCNLTDLQANTTYYVRAYAINSKGTAYGEEVSFTTKVEVVDNPSSNLRAMPFSVSESKQVYFSKGNLQYHPANDEWRFAENQTDYIGDANSSISSTYDGWIDLFGWGTGDNPTNIIQSTISYPTFVDWGINKIGNDASNTWRTLSKDEWGYLFETRTNAALLYGVAQVAGVNGMILLPDNWVAPAGITFKSGLHTSLLDDYSVYQSFTVEQWSKMEQVGAVFLSASGWRNGSIINDLINTGCYWSSTAESATSNSRVYHLWFSSRSLNSKGTNERFGGAAVRLVKDLQQETVKSLPSVTTSVVTQITETNAVAGGNVTSDGGAEITERGVVYSTNINPVITNLNNTIRPCGSGTGVFTYTMTGLQPNTTYYVRAYAKNDVGTAYGEEVSFTTKEESSTPSNGTENGYAYVDLGLSVKWATMNVGASKPEEYGDYYAWGETTTNTEYNWSTYKYCYTYYNNLTKYNTYSSYGTVDNKTTLELGDDAARAKLGGAWRLPTEAEFLELREQCTWTWTTQNGVNGYKVTSKSNGNNIFLPAAGYRMDSKLKVVGSDGCYWANSISSNLPYCAWRLDFNASEVKWNGDNRCYGQSVRPVCP